MMAKNGENDNCPRKHERKIQRLREMWRQVVGENVTG